MAILLNLVKSTAVVGRTVGIICESVSVTDSLRRLTQDSTFFLVYIFKCVITLCICIMIIISVFVLCTCITVNDFIFLRARVYHVDRKDFLKTDAAAERRFYYTCQSARGAAHAASATSFLYRDGATVKFNYL